MHARMRVCTRARVSAGLQIHGSDVGLNSATEAVNEEWAHGKRHAASVCNTGNLKPSAVRHHAVDVEGQ
eukprot:6691332-Alexandrium_andersonii.AAC.1